MLIHSHTRVIETVKYSFWRACAATFDHWQSLCSMLQTCDYMWLQSARMSKIKNGRL